MPLYYPNLKQSGIQRYCQKNLTHRIFIALLENKIYLLNMSNLETHGQKNPAGFRQKRRFRRHFDI